VKNTIICRCEEILLHEIEEAVDAGCRSVGAVKRYTRAGMGPCQGRSCSKAVSAIIARRRGIPFENINQDKPRFPIVPLPLGTLADIDVEESEDKGAPGKIINPEEQERAEADTETAYLRPPKGAKLSKAVDRAKVVVVGAGYHGASIANALCAAGVSTILLEQHEAGTGASGNNFGCIQLQDSNPGTSFLLNQRGFQRMERMEEELKADLEFRYIDSLLYAQSREEMNELESLCREKRALGLNIELLEPKDIKRFEPFMDTDAILGATWYRQASINPFKYLFALIRNARSNGLDFREHRKVDEILTSGGTCTGVRLSSGEIIEAEYVVVAAGAWSGKLCRSMGLELPVNYIIGEAFVTEALEPHIMTFISSASFFTTAHGSSGAATSFTAAQTLSGNILIGETGEPGPDDPDRALHLTSGAHCRNIPRLLSLLYPALAKVPVMRSWTTCSPSTPDFEPFLGFPGKGAPEGLILACGFKSSVVISPVAGEIVRDLVVRGETFCDLAPFRL
jgi:sarcosine oxidase, subunit beta